MLRIIALSLSQTKVNVTWSNRVLADWLIAQVKDDAGNPYVLEQLLAMNKNQIWAICQLNKPKKEFMLSLWVAAWIREHNVDIKVLYLPVAHPQLNPIELMWNWLKSYVARNNHSFSMIDIERLTRQRLAELGAVYCKKAFEHSLKFAEDYRISDNIMIDDADHG